MFLAEAQWLYEILGVGVLVIIFFAVLYWLNKKDRKTYNDKLQQLDAQTDRHFDRIDADNQALRDANTHLMAQVDGYRAMTFDLQTDLGKIKVEMAKIVPELEKLRRENEHLRERITLLEKENHRLKTELADNAS